MRRMFANALRAALAVLVFWPALAAAEETNDDLLAGWVNQLRYEARLIAEDLERPRTVVPAGGMLRAGAAGPRVFALAQRLSELGHMQAPEAELAYTMVFDETVHEAVSAYQDANGLFVDGVVGPQTLAALNRTREDNLRALQWTIGEIETLREQLPPTFMIVNIPSAEAMLIQGGSIIRHMNVAVGRPDRQTPIMEDEITQVILNPTWTVPPTIMRNDVLPTLRASGSPGVSNASVYLNGVHVNPGLIDWYSVEPWQIAVVQRPGAYNALGLYRFTMTNGQAIFLHDTNNHGVFERVHRAVSSGCVRVEDSRGLAEWLVARQGLPAADLAARLAAGYTQAIDLEEPLPVFLSYWTATVDPDSGVVVHRDIYYRMGEFTVSLPTDSDTVGG